MQAEERFFIMPFHVCHQPAFLLCKTAVQVRGKQTGKICDVMLACLSLRRPLREGLSPHGRTAGGSCKRTPSPGGQGRIGGIYFLPLSLDNRKP